LQHVVFTTGYERLVQTPIYPHEQLTEDFNTGNIIPGEWRVNVDTLQSVNSLGSNNYKRAAEEVRSSYARYFAEENPLPWQWQKLVWLYYITETDM
jgi:hypothetical protein